MVRLGASDICPSAYCPCKSQGIVNYGLCNCNGTIYYHPCNCKGIANYGPCNCKPLSIRLAWQLQGHCQLVLQDLLKKHPQDVLSFQTLFPNDPATKVRLCCLAKTSLTVNIVLHIRISFQSLKTTCLDGSLIENLMAMTSPFFPLSGTQST